MWGTAQTTKVHKQSQKLFENSKEENGHHITKRGSLKTFAIQYRWSNVVTYAVKRAGSNAKYTSTKSRA